jgi:hypothetical protein
VGDASLRELREYEAFITSRRLRGEAAAV